MRKDESDLEGNLGFVRALARGFSRRLPSHVDRDDLAQEAALALVLAPETYEVSHGIAFRSYLFQKTQGALLDWCRAQDIHPSRRRWITKFNRVRKQVEQRLGRRADEEEIATSLGMTLARYQRLSDRARVLGCPVDEARLADPTKRMSEERPFSPEMLLALDRELARLPRRTRLILVGYYEDEKSFSEIAPSLGLSASRTAKIHEKTLLLLRARLARDRIKESASVADRHDARSTPRPVPEETPSRRR
jgi:RNA polymerase sigma factor for flagellar operon FliA